MNNLTFHFIGNKILNLLVKQFLRLFIKKKYLLKSKFLHNFKEEFLNYFINIILNFLKIMFLKTTINLDILSRNPITKKFINFLKNDQILQIRFDNLSQNKTILTILKIYLI